MKNLIHAVLVASIIGLFTPILAYAGFSGGGGGGGGAPAPVTVVTNWGAYISGEALPAVRVIPTGTNVYVNSSANDLKGIALTLPATPTQGQMVTIATGANEIDQLEFNAGSIPIKGPLVNGIVTIAMDFYTKVDFVYDATAGWVMGGWNKQVIPTGAGIFRVGTASAPYDGWDWHNNGSSTDYYFYNNNIQIQSTNGSTGTPVIRFWAQSTLDVTNVSNGYSGASTAGFYSTTPNSHLGQSASSTNDDQVEVLLTTTNSGGYSGLFIPGAPAGAGNWLVYKNAPFYFGRAANVVNNAYGTGVGGMDGVIDMNGNLDWKNTLSVNTKPVITTQDTRAGQAGVTVTVGATPFAYTAGTGGDVAISGGSVTAITKTRAGVVVWSSALASADVPVRAGDIVTITYTIAPAVYLLAN